MSKDKGDNVPTAARQLTSFLQRVERLEEDKKAVGTDIREVYAEAKSSGFDVKVLREIVKRRRKTRQELEEQDALLATYETNIDSVLLE